MPTIVIDNRNYDLDSLSAEAKQQLQMLQIAEQKVARLNVLLAIAQTARNAYANAMKQLLPTPLEQAMAQGDTLKIS